jgi:hypothetical protein
MDSKQNLAYFLGFPPNVAKSLFRRAGIGCQTGNPWEKLLKKLNEEWIVMQLMQILKKSDGFIRGHSKLVDRINLGSA